MFLKKIRKFVGILYSNHYFEDSITTLKIIVHYTWFEDVASHYLEKEINSITKSQNS